MTNDNNPSDFFAATGTKGFKVVNHNDKDFEAFNQFQNALDSKYSKLERDRNRQERISNVKKWDASQPPRWRGADLKTITNPAAQKVEALIRKHRWSSFYIKGEPGVGKSYLSLGIARRYISLGWVTPSQIKDVSEESLMSISKMGFAGQDKFSEFFNSNLKLYIFDNVGSRDSYDKREAPMWEQILDHIYTNDLAVIFTGLKSAASFSEKLSSPAGSKFRHLIDGKIIEMTGKNSAPSLSDGEDEDRAEVEKFQQNKSLFGKFDK